MKKVDSAEEIKQKNIFLHFQKNSPMSQKKSQLALFKDNEKNGQARKLNRIIPFLLMVCATLTSSLRAQNPEILEPILPQFNADSLRQTVLDLQNFGSRFALREGGNREVAEYLVQRLNNYGIPAAIDSFYQAGYNWLTGSYEQWFYNVKGVLPAVEPMDDSIVIVGAHLDAISYDPQTYSLLVAAPGADDNASGVAVMMELARICHENGLLFHRDIHFMAYDGEELGLFGGYYDAQTRAAAGEKVAVMLNNDMVSFQPDDNWRLTLHWYDNALDVLSRAADLCAQYTDIDPNIPSSSQNGNAAASDSYAYFQSGFRAVFAIEYTFSTSYHTDHDVADSNNYDYHADVARYNMAMLAAYAELANGVGVEEHPQQTISMHLSPNPVSDKAVLLYSLEDNSPVDITVFDLTGRTMFHQSEDRQSAGTYNTELDFSDLPVGIYLCQLRTSQGVQTVKFVRQ